MLAGELRCCTVRLTNSGSGALANLRLAVASPDVFCGARSPDGGASSAALLAEPVPVESFRDGQALYALGPGARLAPGQSLRWPLWLHPRAPGELTFHYVWHYEPEEPVDGMRYRCGVAAVWLVSVIVLHEQNSGLLQHAGGILLIPHAEAGWRGEHKSSMLCAMNRLTPAEGLFAGCCAWRTA